ncbi:hypothetical protein MHI37_15450 [Paenibacillus sp. FSL H8-0548]|uniref:hypothetical protein n=1 Tax=Paenibacillus sp. FSL H8-0548 TaxID=1920422 RepID=UPI0026D63EA9|nr:hypothetical protein [Paenibacillus sp. FSL H8-0548]
MININVLEASMTYSKEDGYVGKVHFGVEGQVNEYEIALHSKKGKEWGYGLFFLNQSGKEEELLALEDLLEEEDELFDFLVDTAKEKLEKAE